LHPHILSSLCGHGLRRQDRDIRDIPGKNEDHHERGILKGDLPFLDGTCAIGQSDEVVEEE
jgi:hypothetical protein